MSTALAPLHRPVPDWVKSDWIYQTTIDGHDVYINAPGRTGPGSSDYWIVAIALRLNHVGHVEWFGVHRGGELEYNYRREPWSNEITSYLKAYATLIR